MNVAEEADPNGYLIRFLDGPLNKRSNINTLAGGGNGNLVIPRATFGWPLPDRLAVRQSDDLVQVVDCGDLPDEEFPGGLIYVKVSESQLPESMDAPDSRVMRGAAYQLEAS